MLISSRRSIASLVLLGSFILGGTAFLATRTWNVTQENEKADVENFMTNTLRTADGVVRTWFARLEEATRLLSGGMALAHDDQVNPWLNVAASALFSGCVLYNRISDTGEELEAWKTRARAINNLTTINMRANLSAPPLYLVTSASTTLTSAVGVDAGPTRFESFSRLTLPGVPLATTGFVLGTESRREAMILYRALDAEDPLRAFVSCSLFTDTLRESLEFFTEVRISVKDRNGSRVIVRSPDACDASTTNIDARSAITLAARDFEIIAQPCAATLELLNDTSAEVFVGLICALGVSSVAAVGCVAFAMRRGEASRMKGAKTSAEHHTLMTVLSYVFHELRNPLSGILEFTGLVEARARKAGMMLEDESLSEEYEIIHKCANRAEEVLNSMHALQSSLRHQSMDAVDFASYNNTVVRRWGAHAYKDTTLLVHSSADRILFMAHLMRINQMVTMGMSNALKYCTEGGTAWVATTVARSRDGRPWFMFHAANKVESMPVASSFLKNSGAIPDNAPKHLVLSTVSAWEEESTARHRGVPEVGSGFGLTVARSIALSLGGYLSTWVDGSTGAAAGAGGAAGTAHYAFAVPIQDYKDPSSDEEVVAWEGGESPFRASSALILDDLSRNATAARTALIKLGFDKDNIITFTSPLDAVAHLRKPGVQVPTFGLVDMFMPDMTGDDFVESIKDLPCSCVFMTAAARGVSFRAPIPVIYKPLSMERLRVVLRDLMEFV